MVHFVYYLTNLLFSDISLIYYNINLRSSLIFCPFSGDIFCSLGISLSDSDPLTELNNKSFKYVALYFITKVVTLEFLSVNHTSLNENSELKVFLKM